MNDDDIKTAVLAATEGIPGIVPGSVTVEVEDIDEPTDYGEEDDYAEYTIGDNRTPGALDVDGTWREIRRPVSSLAEFRSLVKDSSYTKDIALRSDGFAVTDECAVPVASFVSLEDARLFLSARTVLALWTASERRADLAESRVRGLEQLVNQLHGYDLEHTGKDPGGNIDAHAQLDLAAGTEVESEHDRVIAVHSERFFDTGDTAADTDAPFYIGTREARCLAASLLRSACTAEDTLARRARGEVTSSDTVVIDDPDATQTT